MSTAAPSAARRPVRRLRTALAAAAVAAVFGGGLPQPAVADHAPVRSLTPACLPGFVTPNRFADVAADSGFELAINCIGDFAVTLGTSPGRYSPAGVVSRQQMALFLVRAGAMMGIAWNQADAGFRDIVGLSAEARGSVNALANAKVVQGVGPGRFDPAGTVTRGQMASFLARLADAAALQAFESKGDAFDDDEESVHRAAVDRIAAAGVTGGRGTDRTFDPLAAVNREQMAAFLARTIAVAAAEGEATPRSAPGARPAELTLDQAGDLIEAGQALTGQVTGDRISSVALAAPCTGTVPAQDRDAAAPGVQFQVPTDPQAPMGRCDVDVRVTFVNGRTQSLPGLVLVPGYMDRPELVHTERVGSSGAAGFDTSEVRFVFDEPVRPGQNAEDQFGLSRYFGVDRSTAVRQDGARAVVATFGTAQSPVGAADLTQVSYATAYEGAVIDDQGDGPPIGGRALLNPGGSTATAFAGPTYFADLLSVTDRRPDPADPSRFLVDFTFDSRLRPPVDRVLFDVVLADSSGRSCRPLRGRVLRRITVSCDGTNTAGPGGTVSKGIVSTAYDDFGKTYTSPWLGSLLTRRPTAAPDVTVAAWGPGPDQFTVAFDEPVTVVAGDRFEVLDVIGGGRQSDPPRAEAVPGDPTRVVVTLRNGRIPGYSVLSVRGGAVTSRSTGKGNSFEQIGLPHTVTPTPAGRDRFQDLLSATTDARGYAEYRFSTVIFPEETGGLGVSVGLYLPDGQALVCERPGYGADHGSGGYNDDVGCDRFLRETSTPMLPQYATPAEVDSAVWAWGNFGGVLVQGAQRRAPAPTRPIPLP